MRRAIEPFREVLAGVNRILRDLASKTTSVEVLAEATLEVTLEETFKGLDALRPPVAIKKVHAKASEASKQPDPAKASAQEKVDKDRKRANR